MSGEPLDDATLRLAAIVESCGDAIVSEDLDGTITSWNRAAQKLFGYTAAEAIGQSTRLITSLGGDDADAEIHAQLRRGDAVSDVEVTRRRKDGSLVRASLTISPVLSSNGTLIGFSSIIRSATTSTRAERLARRLAAIVQSSDDAIASKDLNGIVTSWNGAAERLFGYTAAEMIGQPIKRVIPLDRHNEADDVLFHIRQGLKVDHFETIRQRKDGTLFPVSLTVSPILDGSGQVIGASKIARDISERRRQEEERTRLLAVAQEQAAITEKLNEAGARVSSTLDPDAIVQAVTDTATAVTNAEFGVFFFKDADEQSTGRHVLSTRAGISRDAFARFPQPRVTELFGVTFRGDGIVRLADVTADPRFGRNAPYHGLPPGHLPVRSYLAVPVRSRSGQVLGALLFGHSKVDVFTEQHERLALGIASWASLALENARLYVSVQEASRLKDEFLATLSHELRTPLNAVLGYARMIRSGLLTGEKQNRGIETIERNASSLAQLVEDVLDVARIISGKIRLNVQPVDVPRVVRDAIETVLPAANARGVRVETLIDANAVPISGDPERLQQIVWNLLSNAVKFTEHGGRIQARVTQVNSHVEIVISDTGIGIPPEFLPHIFERFRQADSGTTRQHGGVGLGLSIARHLVEMHGGSIHVTSDGKGKGSTFRVTLPLMIQLEADVRAQVGTRASPSAARVTVPDLRGVHVLAVDDDRDALRLVTEILEAAGARVTAAASAMEALSILETNAPDVLVTDVAMPQMDGFALLAQVRQSQDPAIRDVPAAALTAYARSGDRQKALRSGFQVHLAKPIDPGELMGAVATLVNRAFQATRP